MWSSGLNNSQSPLPVNGRSIPRRPHRLSTRNCIIGRRGRQWRMQSPHWTAGSKKRCAVWYVACRIELTISGWRFFASLCSSGFLYVATEVKHGTDTGCVNVNDQRTAALCMLQHTFIAVLCIAPSIRGAADREWSRKRVCNAEK